MRTVRNQKHQSNAPRLFYTDIHADQKLYIAWCNGRFTPAAPNRTTVSYKRTASKGRDLLSLDFTTQANFFG